MKTQYIILGIVAIVLVGAGFFFLKSQSTTKPASQTEKTTMKTEEKMMGIGYMLKDGKMMIDENEKLSPMPTDVTLKDGTVVSTNGEVTKKDGTKVMLKEGESIWQDGSIVEPGKMMKTGEKEGAMMQSSYSGKVIAGKSSPFLRYTKADYDKAKAAGKIIFLDFYANWCPTCRAEAPDLQAGFDSLTTDKVVGFRVDWEDSDTTDEDKQITKDFTVLHQTTKIILKDGKEVTRTQDQWDKDTFAQQINAVVGQ